MIEATLERIAVALEVLAGMHAGSPVAVNITTEPVLPQTEPVKKARGRPAKITTEEKAKATSAEVVTKPEPGMPTVDDFLDTPPLVVTQQKPLTLEDVRGALQVYAGKNGSGPEGTAKARALMTKASSNGAVRLNVAKDVVGGDQGVLLVADYAAVIKAALA